MLIAAVGVFGGPLATEDPTTAMFLLGVCSLPLSCAACLAYTSSTG